MARPANRRWSGQRRSSFRPAPPRTLLYRRMNSAPGQTIFHASLRRPDLVEKPGRSSPHYGAIFSLSWGVGVGWRFDLQNLHEPLNPRRGVRNPESGTTLHRRLEIQSN